MNTATLEQTSAVTFDPAVVAFRKALVKTWRANPQQTSYSHAAYALIRGKSIEKTFTPITRPGKLLHRDPNATRDECIRSTLKGYRSAWGWASEVFEEMGLQKGKYGDYDLSSHPVLAQWVEEAQSKEEAWRI